MPTRAPPLGCSYAVLLDSDWIIDYLTGVPETVARVDALRSEGVSMSIVSLAELYEGTLYSRDPQAREAELASFVSAVDVLPLDDGVCRIFASERGRLRALGAPIADFDLLIGATAIRHGLTLLTNNRRHFERISGLTIIPS